MFKQFQKALKEKKKQQDQSLSQSIPLVSKIEDQEIQLEKNDPGQNDKKKKEQYVDFDQKPFTKQRIIVKEGNQEEQILEGIYQDDNITESTQESIKEKQNVLAIYSEDIDDIDESIEDNNLTNQQIDVLGKNKIEGIRDYQKEIFLNSCKQNSLVYLETGTGKTLIATMLIYYYFKKQKKVENKKKIVFVANTVQLIEQQYDEIKHRLKLVSDRMEKDNDIKQVLKFDDGQNYKREFKNDHITKVHGQFKGKENLKSVERFSKTKWEQIKSVEILIMMGQVLLNGLRRGYIHIDDIEVIIFDECHHTRGDHPYNLIMYEFYHFYKRRNEKLEKEQQKILPKIYGLTASPVLDVDIKSGEDVLKTKIEELCSNLDSQFAPYDIQKAESFIKEANISVESYNDETKIQNRAKQVLQGKILKEKLVSLLEDDEEQYSQLLKFYTRFRAFKEQYENQVEFAQNNKEVLEDLEKIICCDSLQLNAQLGKYAVSLFFEDVNNELQKTKSFQYNQEAMENLQKLIDEETKEFSKIYKVRKDENFSLKFKFLFDQLKNVMESDKLKFDNFKKKIGYNDNRLHKTEIKEKMETYAQFNQSMILIFVQEKIIIKYLQKVLIDWIKTHQQEEQYKFYQEEQQKYQQDIKNAFSKFDGQIDQYSRLFRYDKIICLTGHSNVYDQKKKNISNNTYKSSEFQESSNFEMAQQDYDKQNQKIDYLDENEGKFDDLDKIKMLIGDHQHSRQKLTLVTFEFEVQKQKENIEEFRKKRLQIILSTSVTEEGFDIPSCNLVISFNKLSNLKSYVQIKGRARKKDSKFLIMAKNKKQKEKFEQNNNMYKEYIKLIKQIAPQVQKKEVKVRLDYRYRIEKTTNAILNTNWANMLFHNYANYLHYEADWNIKAPFFYFIETKGVSYVCQIILPPSAASERRFYCSRPQTTKEEAKKDACFQACIILKTQYKIFDEHLCTQQQLINQKQNVMHEAIYEDKEDKKLIGILNKYTVTELDLKQKYKKTFFDSIMGYVLNFSFFVKELRDNSEIEVQIYLLKFNENNKMPEKGFYKNYDSELGFIHSTAVPIRENIKYILQLKQDDAYATMIYQDNYVMNQEQYKRLLLINQYLNSVALGKDIEFFAEYTKNEMNPNGKLFKDKQKIDNIYYDYKFEDSDSFKAMITLLTPSQTNPEKYVINEEHITKLESYINYMTDVYKMRNKTRLSEEERKIRKDNLKNDPKAFADQKVNPDYECVNFFKDEENQNTQLYIDCKEKLVLQNICSGKHLNRFIYLETKKIGEVKKELANNREGLQIFLKSKQKTEIEEINFQLFDNHMAIKAQLFDKKYLRKIVNHYLLRNAFLQEDESKNKEFKHFPTQFTIFPMNVALLMKLKIFHISLLYQIRDSFAIHHFQQIRIPKMLNKKHFELTEEKKKKMFSFELHQNDHFICNNYNDLIQAMRHDDKYNLLALQFTNNYDKQYVQEELLQPNKNKSIITQHQYYLNSAKGIKLSELTKSLTSSEYTPNKENANLERYEFLGDTVLKCLASLQIYFQHPTKMEKYLHVFRTQIIFNKNLSKLAIKNKLFKYILAAKMDHCQPLGIKFEQSLFEDDDENKEKQIVETQIQIKDEYDMADKRSNDQMKSNLEGDDNENIDNENNSTFKKIYLKPFSRQIKGKTHADCLESLIGVFYWEKKDLSLCQFLLHQLKVLENPDLTFNHIFSQNLRESQLKNPIFHHLKNVESILGYRFHNINLLFQAFTLPEFDKICQQIPSGQSNITQQLMRAEKIINNSENLNYSVGKEGEMDIINNNDQQDYPEGLQGYNLSNQRLEFLGDAVLDLIVVEQLFEKYESAKPGELTIMKTQVVQNKTLCLANLDNGFYKYIIGNVQKNWKEIDHLLNDKEELKKDICKMYNEQYNQTLIKTLGDVIESLVCAIFIDTELDYVKTREIVLRFMKPFIDFFTSSSNLLNLNTLQVTKIIKQEFGEVNLNKDENDILDGLTKYYITRPNQIDLRLIEIYATDEIDALDKIYIEIDQYKKTSNKKYLV